MLNEVQENPNVENEKAGGIDSSGFKHFPLAGLEAVLKAQTKAIKDHAREVKKLHEVLAKRSSSKSAR